MVAHKNQYQNIIAYQHIALKYMIYSLKNLKLYFIKLHIQQMHYKVIILGREWITNIFEWGKSLEFLPWTKKHFLLMLIVGFKPMIS